MQMLCNKTQEVLSLAMRSKQRQSKSPHTGADFGAGNGRGKKCFMISPDAVEGGSVHDKLTLGKGLQHLLHGIVFVEILKKTQHHKCLSCIALPPTPSLELVQYSTAGPKRGADDAQTSSSLCLQQTQTFPSVQSWQLHIFWIIRSQMRQVYNELMKKQT